MLFVARYASCVMDYASTAMHIRVTIILETNAMSSDAVSPQCGMTSRDKSTTDYRYSPTGLLIALSTYQHINLTPAAVHTSQAHQPSSTSWAPLVKHSLTFSVAGLRSIGTRLTWQVRWTCIEFVGYV